MAVLQAVQAFAPQLRNKSIQVLSDNVTTVAYINRLGGGNREMCDIMTTLWNFTYENNIALSAKFLAGWKNDVADCLSRMVSPYDWKLHPDIFKVIDRIWGPHTIDRFVAQHNTQLKRYNSLFLDPNTEGIDSLAQTDWGKNMNYCNPPFWMIGKVLDKIENSQAEATLIAPKWKARRWFAKLKKLTVDVPMKIKCNWQTVQHSGVVPEVLKNRKWVIYAWRVSGKRS